MPFRQQGEKEAKRAGRTNLGKSESVTCPRLQFCRRRWPNRSSDRSRSSETAAENSPSGTTGWRADVYFATCSFSDSFQHLTNGWSETIRKRLLGRGASAH